MWEQVAIVEYYKEDFCNQRNNIKRILNFHKIKNKKMKIPLV